jgi:hypothetical protein
VRVEYDEKADAMYIWLRKAKYDISEKLAENVVIDLDKSVLVNSAPRTNWLGKINRQLLYIINFVLANDARI